MRSTQGRGRWCGRMERECRTQGGQAYRGGCCQELGLAVRCNSFRLSRDVGKCMHVNHCGLASPCVMVVYKIVAVTTKRSLYCRSGSPHQPSPARHSTRPSRSAASCPRHRHQHRRPPRPRPTRLFIVSLLLVPILPIAAIHAPVPLRLGLLSLPVLQYLLSTIGSKLAILSSTSFTTSRDSKSDPRSHAYLHPPSSSPCPQPGHRHVVDG